ncbi:MAG TPA: hypothetical protein VGW77_13785 [Candidatus Binatia bacterium]|jgi:hypothetical protein|nr:hypothetical protein [Candidatus Binatia bacterium]
MDRIGYLLSEAPVFFFMIWFAIRLVQYRRYRRNLPIVTENDRRMLFQRPKEDPGSFRFCLRLILAILAVTVVGYLQFITLAPLGAAILSGTLLLTSATIVHRLLIEQT